MNMSGKTKTRYFRAGIGAVIYRNDGKILVFRRIAPPIGEWQFTQGGIDEGEEAEDTLYREVYEETGIRREDMEEVHKYPDWLSYTYRAMTSKDNEELVEGDLLRLGQTHRWFFLKVGDEYEVDLSQAPDEEFDDFKWIEPQDAVEMTWKLKGDIYQKLVDYLEQNILAESSK